MRTLASAIVIGLLVLTLGCGGGSKSVPPVSGAAESLYVISSNFSPPNFSSQLASYKLDPATGSLALATPAGQIGTGLNGIVSNSKFLYISTDSQVGPLIEIFSVSPEDGSVKSKGVFTAPGPCGLFCSPGFTGALALSPDGRFLFYGSSLLATYANQKIGVLSVNQTDGSLTSVPGSPFPADLIPFGVSVHPSGKFLYTANMGTPSVGFGFGPILSISCFSIDSTTGALTPVAGSPFPITSSVSWPVQMTLHPSGRFLYLPTSGGFPSGGGNGVLGWSIDASSGALKALAASPFDLGQTPIEGTMNRAGTLFYANAPGGMLAGYSVDSSSGALTPLAGFPLATGLRVGPPSMDPSGNFLYLGDSKSQAIVGYRVGTNGALTPLSASTSVGGVVSSINIVSAP